MNKQSKVFFFSLIAICIAFIIGYSLYKSDEKVKTINNIVKTVTSSEEAVMLYIGSSDCEACDLQASSMSLLFDNYDFKYFYVDFNELTTTSSKNSFLEDIEVDTSNDFVTPTIVIYKGGKIIDTLSGVTSINKIFNSLRDNGIIDEEEALPVNYLTLSSFITLKETNAKSILVLSSATNEDAVSAQEVLWGVASDNNITINYLQLNDLTEDEGATFEKQLNFYSVDNNEVTTPTVLIIENGQVVNYLNYLHDADEYVDFFKENGIIE